MPKFEDDRPQSETSRKFPFRSQSLRLKRISSFLSKNKNPLKRQQSLLPANTSEYVTNTPVPCVRPTSQLILTERDITILTPLSQEKVSSSILVSDDNITYFNNRNRLTRHHSMKSIKKSSSVSQISQIFVGNAPTSLKCNTSLDDNIFEDEGVVTQEESEDDDDYCDDERETLSNGHNINREVILKRDVNLGLGIFIAGGCDCSMPITIVNIMENSPADNIRDIFIGDEIISINNILINESTTHHNAIRLLKECGDTVHLTLKHSKAVTNFSKKWKQRTFSVVDNTNNNNNTATNNNVSSLNNDFTNVEDNCSKINIKLFASGISRYVPYGDKIRDCGFEVQTNDGRSIPFDCGDRRKHSQLWYKAIKSTIDSIHNNFMQNFNKHSPKNEQFFYMGVVSEFNQIMEANSPKIDSSLMSIFSTLKTQQHRRHRWLTRYLIIKGGKMYVFKCAPTSTLLNYNRKISSLFYNRNNSNGSSLGSVGSSTSDASNSSISCSNNGLVDSFSSSHTKVRPEKFCKINKCLDNELKLVALDHWDCFTMEVISVKPEKQWDEKKDCLILNDGKNKPKYFSTECSNNRDSLIKAWNLSRYYSVVNEVKTYTVVLHRENLIGSLRIDWRTGFSFYDPKRNESLWSFDFNQLVESSDDGKDLLSLTFSIFPGNRCQFKTKILRCSCLSAILYCIDAFLRAKLVVNG